MASLLSGNGREVAMEDLDLAEIVEQLLAAVRKLPSGQKRQDALKEVGLLRNRMCELLEKAAKSN